MNLSDIIMTIYVDLAHNWCDLYIDEKRRTRKKKRVPSDCEEQYSNAESTTSNPLWDPFFWKEERMEKKKKSPFWLLSYWIHPSM